MMKRDTFLNLKYLFLNREDKIRYMKEILSACQTVLLLSLYLQPQISLRYLFDVCLSKAKDISNLILYLLFGNTSIHKCIKY